MTKKNNLNFGLCQIFDGLDGIYYGILLYNFQDQKKLYLCPF